MIYLGLLKPPIECASGTLYNICVFMHNRKYDPDFKREAVSLVVEENLSVREVERNLGITYG